MSSISSAYKNISKHGAIYGIGGAVNKGITILLLPLYAAFLHSEEFGIYSMLLITTQVLSMIFSFQLGTAMFRSYYDYSYEEKQKKLIGTTIILSVALVAFYLLLGILISSPLSKLLINADNAVYLELMILSSGLQIINLIPLNIFRLKMESRKYILSIIFLTTLRIGLIIVLVAIYNGGILGLIYANLITQFVSFFVLYYLVWKHFRLAILKSEIRVLLKFGSPLILSNIATYVIYGSGIYFIKFYGNLSDVGVYNMAYKFGMVAQFVLVFPLGKVWTPLMLSVKDQPWAKDFYKNIFLAYTIFGLFFVSTFSVFSKDIFQFLTNPDYYPGYKIIPFILITYLFSGIGRVAGNVGIMLKRKTIYNMYAFVFAALINIGANFMLVPKIGLMGAAVSTALALFSSALLKIYFSQKLYRIHYNMSKLLLPGIVLTGIYFATLYLHLNSIFLEILIKLILVTGVALLIYYFDTNTRNIILGAKKAVFNKVYNNAAN